MSDEPQVPAGCSGERIDEVEVVVIGADPPAVSVAAGLSRHVASGELLVVDREPWLARDVERLERLELARVDERSPLADAMRTISTSLGDSEDRFPRDVGLAREWCRRGLEALGLGRCWRAGRLGWLVPVDDGRSTVVQLADGSQVRARHVVLSSGSPHRVIPHWVFDLFPQPIHRLVHLDDLDLRSLDLAGDEVVVVGEQLSMHVATAALQRGASRVDVLSEQPAAAHGFGDRDAGPRGAAASATQFIYDGRLRLRDRTRVIAASRAGARSELVLGDERRVQADRVWLATGTRADLLDDRRLRFVHELLPSPDGRPLLDDHLRWPGSNIHVVGPAAVVAGPDGLPRHPSASTGTQQVVQSIRSALGVGGSPVRP